MLTLSRTTIPSTGAQIAGPTRHVREKVLLGHEVTARPGGAVGTSGE